MTRSTDPVPISTSAVASGATVIWRHRGRLNVTLVNKLSFALGSGVLRALAPAPVSRAERSEPGSARVEPDDLAPFLSRADVWVAGLRQVERATPRAPRLTIRRGNKILLDKAVEITPERAQSPFSGFAPLSKRWPIRTALLRHTVPAQLEGTAIVVPDEMDWRYFQSAPLDQQTNYLEAGDDIIVENWSNEGQRLAFAFPTIRGEAALEEGPLPPVPFRMIVDTLAIDLNVQVCHVLLRGSLPLERGIESARIERQLRVIGASDLQRSNVVGIAPAREDFAATARLSDAEELRSIVASLSASKSIPPPASRPSAPPISEVPYEGGGSTAVTSSDEIIKLRQMYATPFEEAKRAGSPVPPTKPGVAEARTDYGQTAMVSADEVAALRAKYATPFEQSKQKTAAPQSISPVVSSERAAPVTPADFGSTALVSPAEVAALRAKYATPFEQDQSGSARARVGASTPPLDAPPKVLEGTPFREVARAAPPTSSPAPAASYLPAALPVASAPLALPERAAMLTPPPPPVTRSGVNREPAVATEPLPPISPAPPPMPVVPKPSSVSAPPLLSKPLPPVPPPPPMAKPKAAPALGLTANPRAPEMLGRTAPSSSGNFGATAEFDPREVAALRAAFATPFDNPFKEGKAPKASPLPALASPSGGDTAVGESDEVRELRKKYAPAFLASIRESKPPEAEAVPLPKRKGSLGACFLAAIADHGTQGMFDNTEASA